MVQRMAVRRESGFLMETFRGPRDEARVWARNYMYEQYPKGGYMTEVAAWSQHAGDVIEFTMRRLTSAD
jgi:hypothetical protein